MTAFYELKKAILDDDKYHSELIYNYMKYHLGDTVYIKGKDNTKMIARIIKIYNPRYNPDRSEIKVQWYYSKHDLQLQKVKINSVLLSQLPANELFTTNHFDKIRIKFLFGK